MAAIVTERTIQAAPGPVWRALTQSDEIGHWWTNDLNATLEVGALMEFRFGEWGEFAVRFEVAELVQEQHLHWMSRQGPPEWAGTSVIWQLEPVSNGTRLLFTHDGFAQADEAYEQTRLN